MLNTKKLLYILPDVAYIAELLPTKKEHTFAIQTFRQINGEFMDDNEFIAENIEKLTSKIDAEEYHLILPDFLFTNTIIEVQETSEPKVKTYLKDKLLPSLDLNSETHEIDTFVLTQHQGKSKVQISALEKSVLSALASSAHQHGIKITGISPLSWTIKSVISLEPSISVIQIGSLLYLAQHYIGIDQATTAKVEELENIAETIKTLKGGEPSIQTVYLLTNELVADNLKSHVSSTLPLQQLATFKEDETQMPSYVKQIIESGAKSLDIPDYQVPRFALPKATAPVESTATKVETIDSDMPQPLIQPAADEDEDDLPLLPAPTAPTAPTPVKTPTEPVKPELEHEDESENDVEEVSAVEPVASPPLALAATVTPATLLAPPTPPVSPVPSNISAPTLPIITTTPTPMTDPTVNHTPAVTTQPTMISPQPIMPSVAPAPYLTAEPNLSQFSAQPMTQQFTPPMTPNPEIIKNKSGVNNMVKMTFITLAVFFVTVGVGVGIGLGVLSLANRSGDDQVTPVATTPTASTPPVTAPTPVASPSPSPVAELKRADYDILVVNATTIAGHAGQTKKLLEAAKYGKVTASNAKGEYKDGLYVLMKTEDPALVAALEKDSTLSLEFQNTIATEDPKGEFDAVIVLAE